MCHTLYTVWFYPLKWYPWEAIPVKGIWLALRWPKIFQLIMECNQILAATWVKRNWLLLLNYHSVGPFFREFICSIWPKVICIEGGVILTARAYILWGYVIFQFKMTLLTNDYPLRWPKIEFLTDFLMTCDSFSCFFILNYLIKPFLKHCVCSKKTIIFIWIFKEKLIILVHS